MIRLPPKHIRRQQEKWKTEGKPPDRDSHMVYKRRCSETASEMRKLLKFFRKRESLLVKFAEAVDGWKITV